MINDKPKLSSILSLDEMEQICPSAGTQSLLVPGYKQNSCGLHFHVVQQEASFLVLLVVLPILPAFALSTSWNEQALLEVLLLSENRISTSKINCIQLFLTVWLGVQQFVFITTY